MNQNIQAVKQQIETHGGLLTSEMLSKILSDSNQELGNDFNIKQFFDDICKKNNLYDERSSRDVNIKPNWNVNGTNNDYNVIPAINPNGICATFCLTIIPRGFRSIMPKPISPRYNRLKFSKAILLLCEYWFACLRINQENLLITPDWDQSTFEDYYENIIESYASNHNKKVFIIEVSKVGLILRYPY
jgi:hypothetical protein